ncbi:MAG: M23 family metallopeptidase [Candidatus Latescibacteria bacterium]|nr:M23 family metallopeptidase [Candidatus Latescibacterota bacterium]
MNKRPFSLLIIPDNGSELKTGIFSTRIIALVFGLIIMVFFSCLFIIAGYHIKLSQEKDYISAVLQQKKLTEKIHHIKKTLNIRSAAIEGIRKSDEIFRLVGMMNHIDNDMYKAGIGGHTIVDETVYDSFNKDIRIDLIQLAYNFTTLNNRIDIQKKSFEEIEVRLRKNNEIVDNTPTIFPTFFMRVTSGFGWRIHPITGRKEFHKGVDLHASLGQHIYATANGIVTGAGKIGKLGKCIIISHKYGYKTIYGHLDDIMVTTGQKVNKGDIIGTMGNSGRSTGVHLHYGVFLNGQAQDPMNHIIL